MTVRRPSVPTKFQHPTVRNQKCVSLRRKRWVLYLPILVTLPPWLARGETHDRMMASAAWWIRRQLALSVQARFAIPTRLSLFRASVIPISMNSLPSSVSECQSANDDLFEFPSPDWGSSIRNIQGNRRRQGCRVLPLITRWGSTTNVPGSSCGSVISKVTVAGSCDIFAKA